MRDFAARGFVFVASDRNFTQTVILTCRIRSENVVMQSEPGAVSMVLVPSPHLQTLQVHWRWEASRCHNTYPRRHHLRQSRELGSARALLFAMESEWGGRARKHLQPLQHAAGRAVWGVHQEFVPPNPMTSMTKPVLWTCPSLLKSKNSCLPL